MAGTHQSSGAMGHHRSMSAAHSEVDRVEVAVVGAGVRGTQVLLQLAHRWRARPPAAAVRVHVIDPWEPGPGRTWRVDQSALLLMNGPISGTTAFDPGEGPTLLEWARQVAPTLPDLPASARAEVAAVEPHTFCSRALYGHYLRWVYRQAQAELAPSAELVHHRCTVTAARSAGRRTRLQLSDGRALTAEAVVLTLGWLPGQDPDLATTARWIRPGHPAEQNLAEVAAGERLLVRGMGMSFFDAFSLLTEGRGGRFVPAEPTGTHAAHAPRAPGTLRYVPSGQEPHLIVGSRRGVPYRSKPPQGAPAAFPHASLEELGNGRHRRWDFAAELLPAIRRDATLAYYSVLLEQQPHRVRSGPALLKQLRVTPQAQWPELLAEAVPHAADRLDLARVENPGTGMSFASSGEADEWVAADIAADLDQAYLAERSPMKAAMRSIGDARRVVAPLVAFSGISGAGLAPYRRFTSWGAMMSGGPPARRNQQLLAAWRAGVVTFTGPGMQVAPDGDGFTATTSAAPGAHHGDVLLDAWMHAPTVGGTGDPLLHSLVGSGQVREHQVDGVASGAVEVEPTVSRVIGDDGAASAGMFALGIPCEGQRVFTILSPHAGSPSQVIAECAATAGAVADLVG